MRVSSYFIHRVYEKIQKIITNNIFYSKKIKEPFFFNALGKSASSYISAQLPAGLNMRSMKQIGGGAEPLFLLNQRLIQEASKFNCFANHHVSAHPINLAILNKNFKKIIIHVRDPRQATLSYLHNILRNQKTDPELNDVLFLDKNFFKWDFKKQLDYMIDFRLPQIIDWINGWIKAHKDKHFKPKILFTTFEDFKNDNAKFFNKILKFYNIPESEFCYILKKKPKHKGKKGFLFRKGKTNEWREVFSESQQKKMNKMIPEEFFKKFNWKK